MEAMNGISKSKYWSDNIKNIEPYVPGEQPKDKRYIKLNTNESPYSPSPKVIEALKNYSYDNLKLYPDPTCDDLRASIADFHNISKSQVFVGNGSDEVLAFAFMAFFNTQSKPVIFPDITYSFYDVYCNFLKINYKCISLNEDFTIPFEKIPLENSGIVISNPNAPTSIYADKSQISALLERNTEAVVIVDEAYIDFGGESAISMVNKYPNLLVIHTLSKSRSLAGLRVGFAVGNEGLIEGLNAVKNSLNSYTLDRLAIVGATEAIKDGEYFEYTRRKVIDTRERTSDSLKKLGFNVLPSKANFIFVSHPDYEAKVIFAKLREEGILVRYFNKPRINNYLRVSIGNDEEMDTFVDKIGEIVRG